MATRPTPTECAVLGLLTFGECTPYELVKRMQASVGQFWSPAQSAVYASLPRLERDGYASSRRVRRGARGERHLYRITPEGERALSEGLEAPIKGVDKDVLSLKIFFGGYIRRERLLAEMEERRAVKQAHLAYLRDVGEKLRDDPEQLFPYLSVRRGIALTEADLVWFEEATRRLRAEVAAKS